MGKDYKRALSDSPQFHLNFAGLRINQILFGASVKIPFHIHMTDRATTPVESFYHRKKKQFHNVNLPKKCFIFVIYLENLFPCLTKFPYSSFAISNHFIYSKFMQLKSKLFYIQTPILSAGWFDMQEDLTMCRRNKTNLNLNTENAINLNILFVNIQNIRKTLFKRIGWLQE